MFHVRDLAPCINLDKGIYPYQVMRKQAQLLLERYSFLKKRIIGRSADHKEIFLISMGKGKRKIHINGAHHANEWITSFVIMKSIEIICDAMEKRKKIGTFNIESILNQVSYDFVPMVNPDGVELCLNSNEVLKTRPYLKEYNEGSEDFNRWKANINGVDLNRNYDAGFEEYMMKEKIYTPSYAYYQGKKPESEPETKALVALTRLKEYDMVFAYHTQGEVIYWNYKDIELEKCKAYGEVFSKVSGYILDMPEENAASGGYKDWFIEEFRKPGYTIECGLGENPIDPSQADSIIERTLPILLSAAQEIKV